MSRHLIPTANAGDNGLLPAPGAARDHAQHVLARTLWGMASGAPLPALEAMASMIITRVQLGRQHPALGWGADIVGVCTAPWQFACWNPASPTYPQMLAINTTDADFAACLRVARRALAEAIPPPLIRLTHLVSRDSPARWQQMHKPVLVFPGLCFYSLTVDQALAFACSISAVNRANK